MLGGWSKMVGVLSSTHGHNKPTATYRKIPSEKDPRTSWRASSQQMSKRAACETVSPKAPLPEWWPTVGRNLTNLELLLDEWGVYAPHQAPQPLGLAVKRWAPQTSGLENQMDNGSHIQDTQKAIEKWDTSCKGLACTLTQEPAQKQQFEKRLDYMWRFLFFLFFFNLHPS